MHFRILEYLTFAVINDKIANNITLQEGSYCQLVDIANSEYSL